MSEDITDLVLSCYIWGRQWWLVGRGVDDLAVMLVMLVLELVLELVADIATS